MNMQERRNAHIESIEKILSENVQKFHDLNVVLCENNYKKILSHLSAIKEQNKFKRRDYVTI